MAWSNLWQFAVDEDDTHTLTFEGVCTAGQTDGRNRQRAAGNGAEKRAGGRPDGRANGAGIPDKRRA